MAAAAPAPPPTLRISYETEGFPQGSITNGTRDLVVTWDDVLWAAVTVGRPNRQYVFQHGDASVYEAIFRWSLLRMAVEQRGPNGFRLRRTTAAKTLDPTEKGMVNYFLGMTLCKLFAAKCLNTPWLLHLDVFRPGLNPVLTGRSRPDLIGQEHGTGRWHAFESKGRISPPDATVKAKAKEQAQRLVSVDGNPCVLHVGAITHFRKDVLEFYWCDPIPDGRSQFEISVPPDVWRYYYAPIMKLMTTWKFGPPLFPIAPDFWRLEDLDLKVDVHPAVAKPLFHGDWSGARMAAVEASVEITRERFQPDGLAVRAGSTWRERFADWGVSEG